MTITTAEFANILPKSRFRPYSHLHPCKEEDRAFEYSRRRFYKKGKNPGVGKCVGIVEDAVTRESEVFARFLDQIAGEWIEKKFLRRAPKSGYKVFTEKLTGQREEFTLVKYTSLGKVVLRYVPSGTYCTPANTPRQDVNLCFCTQDKDTDATITQPELEPAWGRCTAPALPLQLKAQLSRNVVELVGEKKMKTMPKGYYNFTHRVAKHFCRLLQQDKDPLHAKRHKLVQTAVYVCGTHWQGHACIQIIARIHVTFQ